MSHRRVIFRWRERHHSVYTVERRRLLCAPIGQWRRARCRSCQTKRRKANMLKCLWGIPAGVSGVFHDDTNTHLSLPEPLFVPLVTALFGRAIVGLTSCSQSLPLATDSQIEIQVYDGTYNERTSRVKAVFFLSHFWQFLKFLQKIMRPPELFEIRWICCNQ